jgi:hypothetical protein
MPPHILVGTPAILKNKRHLGGVGPMAISPLASVKMDSAQK